MDSRLPEELVHTILAFLIPPFCAKTFLKFPQNEGWRAAPLPHLRPGAILVSKRWFRIAAPMVYEGVALSSHNHASALARIVKAHPFVALSVRYLRLDGTSMSRDLKALARRLTKVHTVYLNGYLGPGASYGHLEGLQSASPFLRPTTLYLRLAPRYGIGQSASGEELVLQGIVEPWCSIAIIHISNHSALGYRWANVLHRLPMLREIHIPALLCTSGYHMNEWFERARWWENKTQWEWVSGGPAFETFVFHGEGSVDDVRPRFQAENLGHIVDKLRFVTDGL